jgi:hypothetical protein
LERDPEQSLPFAAQCSGEFRILQPGELLRFDR